MASARLALSTSRTTSRSVFSTASAATSLLVFGLKPETAITLNGQAVKQAPSIAIDGRTAIVIPLGKPAPDAGALAERYRAARRALEQARQPVP